MARLWIAALLNVITTAIATTAERPSILFILADDMAWANAGCYGSDFIETPNIDRLAAEGRRYTQAYASASVCSPSRASLMTGLSPAALDLFNILNPHRRPYAKLAPAPMVEELPRNVDNVATVMGRFGYTTALFGKWHLSHGPGAGPASYGFFDEQRLPAAEELRLAAYPGLKAFVTENPHKATGPIVERSIRFMEAYGDEPFVLFASFPAPHAPAEAREEMLLKYRVKFQPGHNRVTPEYAAMMEVLDEGVGWLLWALEELGLAEDTLVFFYSDNGGIEKTFYDRIWVNSNHLLRGGKGELYEGGIRVPLVARWNGRIAPGTVSDQLVTGEDFLASFVDASGEEMPDGYRGDGVSLFGGVPQDRHLYWHFPDYHEGPPCAAVRNERFKLIWFFEDDRCELYDLQADAGEKVDLAPWRTGLVKELKGRLKAWIEEQDGGWPEPNPKYDPDRADEWGERG